MASKRLAVAVLFALALATADAATQRIGSAKAPFKRQYPRPANGHAYVPCPGYVIDHVVPLACGGTDAPANMQWQSTRAATAKDRWELDCAQWLPQ